MSGDAGTLMWTDRPLAGRVALVTGAAKRIGRAIALELAGAGADVCFTYRESRDEAEQTAAELRGLGVRAFAARCELSDAEEIARVIPALIEDTGGLDLLVNNAGRFASATMETISAAEWDAMMAVNARAPLLVAQAALPALRARRGRIVNIGSLGGMHAWTTHAHYCASKAALHMLSATMAKGWAPEVSVNCVAPGMIVQGDEVGEAYQQFAAKTPMGRNGSAMDVAEAVLFFATGPHFVTGQLLAVDGGLGL